MMQDAVRAYRRRAILSLLEYDSDYRLSLDMLDLCLEQTGQNATYDQLQTEIAWLEEQGYVARSYPSPSLTMVTLTDRGLEIARGKARAHGIRDLRPSELRGIEARR